MPPRHLPPPKLAEGGGGELEVVMDVVVDEEVDEEVNKVVDENEAKVVDM